MIKIQCFYPRGPTFPKKIIILDPHQKQPSACYMTRSEKYGCIGHDFLAANRRSELHQLQFLRDRGDDRASQNEQQAEDRGAGSEDHARLLRRGSLPLAK